MFDTISDGFGRANMGPPPSGDWTTVGSYGLAINTLVCVNYSAGQLGVARYNTLYTGNCEVAARISVLPADGESIYLLARANAGLTTYYQIEINRDDAGDDVVTLTSNVGPIVSATVTLVAGDTFGMRLFGKSIEVYQCPSGGSYTMIASQYNAADVNSLTGYVAMKMQSGAVDLFFSKNILITDGYGTQGRTVGKFARVYAAGYDISGDTKTIGPLSAEFEQANLASMVDAVKGYLPNHATASIGALNGIFNNAATTGLNAVLAGPGVKRHVVVALGMRAAPAMGDPAFVVTCNQLDYGVTEAAGAVIANVKFGGLSQPDEVGFAAFWGHVLNANVQRTGANTAIGIDDILGVTANGLVMAWQLTQFSGTNITLTAQHADVNANASFANITGATSGALTAIGAGTVGTAGGLAIKRYIRWQASGVYTSATFVLVAIRA